jgi:hypothetical protein
MGVLVGRSIFTPILLQRERWPDSYDSKVTPLVSPGQEVLPDQPVLSLSRTRSVDVQRAGSPSALISAGNGGKNEVLPAGLRGRVSALTKRGGVVIESHVVRLPGTIGVGRQVAGVLALWQYGPVAASQLIPPGALLVVPGALSFALLRQAVVSGIVGIIASSITLRDLEGFMRADLLKLLAGDEGAFELTLPHLPPMTLLFTEGLGTQPMPAQFVALLSRYQGAIALLNARTSLRRGLFPELLISLPPDEILPDRAAFQTQETELVPGALVHIRAGQYAGALGIVDYLFVYGQKFPSGVRERAARVQCEDGSYCVVPLSSLERIG